MTLVQHSVALLSSRKSDEWRTPRQTFEDLNLEFGFDLDAAATAENAKCARFFTKENSALCNFWIGRVFCNPPYSLTRMFLAKGREEVDAGRAGVCVFLINANTDTRYFHEFVYDYPASVAARMPVWRPGVEVRFLPGRLKFNDGKDPSMRASIIIIFTKEASE